jgi:hypothetical protein
MNGDLHSVKGTWTSVWSTSPAGISMAVYIPVITDEGKRYEQYAFSCGNNMTLGGNERSLAEWEFFNRCAGRNEGEFVRGLFID